MKWDLNRHWPRPISRAIRDLARKRSVEMYLVGGAVRDLLLGRRSIDYDIVTDCAPNTYLGQLARRLHGRPISYPQFGTASIVIPGGARIDLSRMRKERYPRPAALPIVSPSNLLWDLMRRDFTINAMALSLNRIDRGVILDPFDGLGDIAGRRIRVLHERSFIDDPTRIFRALRYAARLGYRPDALTERLMKQAVRAGYHRLLSGERIRHELQLIFEEKTMRSTVRALQNLGLVRVTARTLAELEQLRSNRLLYFLAWSRCRLARQIPRSRTESAVVSELRARKALERRLIRAKSPSQIYYLLRPISDATRQVLFTLGRPPVRRKLSKFDRIAVIKPLVRGADLQRLGIKPGHSYQRILRRAFTLQLDLNIKSRSRILKLVPKIDAR